MKLARTVDSTPAQPAVPWCEDQPGAMAAFIGVGSIEHLEELHPIMAGSLDDPSR